MKRKYYMRGLGFGILITAVLCALVLPKETQPMTDEEIIARATELGYVKDEGGVSADDINKIKEKEKLSGTPTVSEEPDATGTSEVTQEPEGTPGPTQSPVPTPEEPEPPDSPKQPDMPATPTPKPTATAALSPTATATPKPTATVTPTKTPTEALEATATPTASQETEKTSYTITVQRGATARKVAEQLEVCGAIGDANAFVKYLQANKLTDYINIGSFTIPQGASHGEIARILTGK